MPLYALLLWYVNAPTRRPLSSTTGPDLPYRSCWARHDQLTNAAACARFVGKGRRDPTPGGPLENARWPSEVLGTPSTPLAHRWPAPPHTAWDIGPREAVALTSLSAPMSTGDPDCRKGLLRVPIPDAATLTLASVLLLVLRLFGRAARNHQHF